LQIGDGDHVALTTGIITLSDFRQRHVAAGGEGAPLAVYGDFFIFSNPSENRILLNMGGIANFTYLPKTCDAQQVFVTDTGTGNTLIDSFTRFYIPEKNFDENAAIALKGKVLPDFLKALKQNPFFDAPMPKTTGPELFSRDYVFKAAERVGLDLTPPSVCPDVLATLTRFSAETIAEALLKVLPPAEHFTIYMSGGGIHNPLLVKWLQDLLPHCRFDKTDSLGINADAKEAVLFAILANECLAGGTTDFGNRAGVPSVSMGKISFPS
jgi:anhydro-N-acetylmuramic acid kinase